jgi:hypothetical protein
VVSSTPEAILEPSSVHLNHPEKIVFAYVLLIAVEILLPTLKFPKEVASALLKLTNPEMSALSLRLVAAPV